MQPKLTEKPKTVLRVGTTKNTINKMKKVFAVLSVAAMIAFVGCSKEKDCECKGYLDGQYVEGSTNTGTIEDGDCEDLNSTEDYMGYTVSVKCKEV